MSASHEQAVRELVAAMKAAGDAVERLATALAPHTFIGIDHGGIDHASTWIYGSCPCCFRYFGTAEDETRRCPRCGCE